MANKVFETLFKIHAAYTGKAAVKEFNRDLDKTQRNVKQTGTSFTKMFGAAFAAIGTLELFHKAWEKAWDIGTESYKAAKEVRKANDIVRQANAKLVKEGRLRSQDLEKQTQQTIALAEALNKSGLDTEMLEAGLAGLSRSFDSNQIKQMSKGWMDWMVTIHKGAPTQEQAIEDAKKLENFVMKGKAKSLEGLNLTKEQLAYAAKMTKGMTAQQAVMKRSAWIAGIVGKQTGALAEWMKTDEGATYALSQAQEDNLEIMGKPLADASRGITDAMTNLFVALKPVSEQIAGYLTPALEGLGKWMVDNKENIVAFASGAVAFLNERFKELVISIQNTYDQAKWLYEMWNKSVADTQAQWNTLTTNLVSGATAAWEGIKGIWGQMSGWFDENVVKPITGLWDWLLGHSYLTDAAAAGWEEIKGIWGQMSGWFHDNVIQPIANMWGGLTKAGASFVGGGGGFRGGGATGSWGGGAGGGGGGGGGATGAGGGEIGSAEPNAAIAAERAKVMEQLKEPGMRELVAATLAQEQGSAGGRADVLESLVNRAVVTGKHPRDLIQGGGRKGSFYGPWRRGEVQAAMARGMSPAALEEFDKMAGEVGAGRNRIRGRTDQGMVNEVRGAVVKSAGEYYGEMGYKGEKQTAAWQAGMRGPSAAPLAPGPLAQPPPPSLKDMIKPINLGGKGGAGGQQNVTMNPTINVQGVAAGSEDVVAQRIKSVVQDNSKTLLSQLKRAKDDEARLGYV